MKKFKLYCVVMSIIGLIFVFLIVCVLSSNDPRRGYNYTTSGEQIQSTNFNKVPDTKGLTK